MIAEQQAIRDRIRREEQQRIREENDGIQRLAQINDHRSLVAEKQKILEQREAIKNALLESQLNKASLGKPNEEPGFLDTRRFASSRAKKIIEERTLLQSAIARRYETLLECERAKQKKMDQKVQCEQEELLRQANARAQRERVKQSEIRDALIKGLEEEISSHRQRKLDELADKRQLRELLQREENEESVRRALSKAEEIRSQKQLKEHMDEHLRLRNEMKMKPLSLKIGQIVE
jgi:hypothetical protein